ncbi:hypothetical protein NVP1165O_47 [Vibrio phage 1.165.O._10N.261.51.B7]|nr:hypothetical protein NVP1165O_47 [Vibrio phage 1.165.O._10N.261.51.B7]
MQGDYNMSGWISLHRKILEWEWYDDTNVCRLFIHCLLKANHQQKKWKGIEINRGQFITSLDRLSSETGLTVSQIRTCLKKLKSTNEIASKSHTQHTVISIVSYESYQGDDKRISKPVASESQTNDKRIATTNNDNKENKENKVNKVSLDWSATQMNESEISEIKRIRSKAKADVTQRVINQLSKEFDLSRARGFTNDDILNEWSLKGWRSFKDEWMKGKPSKPADKPAPIERAKPTQEDYLSWLK